MATQMIGASIKRVEDPRFITGKGMYTDDVKVPGMVHAVFVRSPHAHARITGIDVSVAQAMPGVVAVYTGQDMADAGVGNVISGVTVPGIRFTPHPAIAIDRVRYVGDIVAVVLAQDPYTAQDAAEAVDVDYDPLPAVVDPKAAVGAHPIHDEISDNVSFNWSIGDQAKTDAAFAAAHHIARVELVNNRLIPNAMEPRAAVCRVDPNDDVTLWVTSQNPHVHRLVMGAFNLSLPEHKFRVIAPDVGGGFGSKIFIYAEEIIVVWAALQSGQPVKWNSTRRESYIADAHGRDHVTEGEMAFDTNGKILGLRVKTWAGMGGYLSTFAPLIPTNLYGPLLSGMYPIPAIYCSVLGVITNTVPVDAYRGAGRPEATYVVERLVDIGAAEMGVDPAELRRRNFIAPSAFPFQTQVNVQYDSGNYEATLDRALERAGYADLRREQQAARQQGRYMGIGFAAAIEACGIAPSAVVGNIWGGGIGLWESAIVRVHPTGKVTVQTGSHSHGQGHETTFAQIVADGLGVPLEDVLIQHGDTAQSPFGYGTYGSRSAAVGGSAIAVSVKKLQDKIKRIAAHLLEAAPEDIDYAEGKATVRGAPERFKTFGEVALQAYLAHNYPTDIEPGLEATTFFDPTNFTFPYCVHIAVVEVDGGTGQVEVKRYIAVDDVGNIINPMIVAGQIHGGVAQGIGQALYESAVYDENGQLVTGSMMDYAVPKARYIPMIETDQTITPAPQNPLGVKGVGEIGAIASPAAIANAVVDALKPFGVAHLDMPITAEKVHAAMHRDA